MTSDVTVGATGGMLRIGERGLINRMEATSE